MGDGGFQMDEAKCPECDAPLRVPDNAEWLTCSYCGTSVHVSYPKQQTEFEPDGTVRDRSTGYGLFRMRGVEGWQVSGTSLQRMGSVSRPYIPHVELRDRQGGVIVVRMGEAGTRNSAGMNALMGMYGGHLAGVSTVHYAEMPDPRNVADAAASNIAASMGASGFRFSTQLACPDLESRRQKEFARIQRAAQAEGGQVANPFIGIILRVYEFAYNGQPWKAAAYVELAAAKDGMGIGEGLGTGIMEGFGGLMDSIGGLFGGARPGGAAGVPNPFGGQAVQGGVQPQIQGGVQPQSQGNDPYAGVMGFLRGGGLLGKMKRDQQAAAQQPMQQPMQQPYAGQQSAQQPYAAQQPGRQPFAGNMPPNQAQAQAQQAVPREAAWCLPDFAQYASGGTIFWTVPFIVTFAAPANDFDQQFQRAFLPLVSSVDIHPDVESLSLAFSQQEAARVQQATQMQLSQNQAAFQAQQAAHRQQQAAFDAYNQSITDARNAHHQQFMASSREQFDHRPSDYSEAIRGVNTYTTSDGREVELSVQADHAWENQAGDVIGTSGSFDPGASWTEIPRT